MSVIIKFTLEVQGIDMVSVLDALKEAARLIEDGYTSGSDCCEEGSFSFKEEDDIN